MPNVNDDGILSNITRISDGSGLVHESSTFGELQNSPSCGIVNDRSEEAQDGRIIP